MTKEIAGDGMIGAQETRGLSRRRMLGYGGGAFAAAIAAPGLLRPALAQTPATPNAAATPASSAPPSWDQIVTQLTAVAPTTVLLAAELSNGKIAPIASHDPDQVTPIGSNFKLWILGALSQQIETGTLEWEQPVEIQERYISVPGGDLRYVKPGTIFTLRYLAEKMMQKSDNTATDHLLFTVGRENVEQAMTTMGVADPGRNIPLISTRELAMMKFAYPKAKVDAYYAASVAERRQLLATEVDQIPYSALANINQTKPLELNRVEWFASRNDLARSMAWLLAQSGKPGLRPVAEVITLDTPIPFDGQTWPYVGYKGGSELGLLSVTWLLQRQDGRFFVYTMGFEDTEKGIDPARAIAVMEAGRDRLALTP